MCIRDRTPGYALYLRHLFEKNGIDIAVLGNYLNPVSYTPLDVYKRQVF